MIAAKMPATNESIKDKRQINFKLLTFYLLSSISYLCNMKILMVCLGNICRSPLAEGILKEKIAGLGLSWQVESAGTNGYHTGEPPHILSQKVAGINGIDISSQRSRKFVKNDLLEFDRIYAMANDVMNDIHTICSTNDHNKKIVLFLNELYPGKQLDVPDPWSGPEKGYHEVYELINRACDAIIENYMIKTKQIS
jgi:protein-tyrosine phosphatase